MDLVDLFRFFGALAVVLGLIAACALLARRFGLAGAIGSASTRRLGLVETLTLDNRRRLILVRRDDREHLILLGPTGEIILESVEETLAEEHYAGVTVYGAFGPGTARGAAYGQA